MIYQTLIIKKMSNEGHLAMHWRKPSLSQGSIESFVLNWAKSSLAIACTAGFTSAEWVCGGLRHGKCLISSPWDREGLEGGKKQCHRVSCPWCWMRSCPWRWRELTADWVGLLPGKRESVIPWGSLRSRPSPCRSHSWCWESRRENLEQWRVVRWHRFLKRSCICKANGKLMGKAGFVCGFKVLKQDAF